MLQRRLFSTTPCAFAKRKQIAIRRKKANIQRQAVLKAERSPVNFDPVVGTPTAFTTSLLTPDTVYAGTGTDTSDAETRGSDSLYFSAPEMTKIQKAVEAAMHERARASPRTVEVSQAQSAYKAREEIKVPSLFSATETNSASTTASNTNTSTSTTSNNLEGDKDKDNDAYDPARVDAEMLAARLRTLTLENDIKSSASSRITALRNSNARTLRAYNTAFAVREFARTSPDRDTGSAEVQAAVLTVRILADQRHMAANKKDVHSAKGFRELVHKRQKILKYLRKESVERYFACIDRLGLQDKAVVNEISM